MNTADVSPESAARAMCQMAARRTGEPPRKIVALLASRYGIDEVAEVVLPVLDEVAARLAAPRSGGHPESIDASLWRVRRL